MDLPVCEQCRLVSCHVPALGFQSPGPNPHVADMIYDCPVHGMRAITQRFRNWTLTVDKPKEA